MDKHFIEVRLDIHKEKNVGCILNESGDVIREQCFPVSKKAVEKFVDEDDIKNKREEIKTKTDDDFDVVTYRLKKDKDLHNIGIAKINYMMQNLEIETVLKMQKDHILEDNMLVIDGPLRFTQKFDVAQFQNVIGLSKSFRPSYNV